MTLSTRVFTGSALLAVSLALSGCGGNTGTQTTSLDRSMTISAASAYASAAPVDTIGGVTIAPLALFSSEKGQSIVLWGSRSETDGTITGVREAAYWTDVAKPLYAKYNVNGGLTSVKDAATGSYVTFSELENSSLVATGVDGTTGKTASIRATMTQNGITVVVLDDGRSRTIRFDELPTLGKRGITRDVVEPLAGFESVYKDDDTRTRIITAIFRAASLVVDSPFDEQLRDVAGFLLLDQLTQSYSTFKGKGLLPSSEPNTTTPVPYVSDLP